jgi:hypothetical protein
MVSIIISVDFPKRSHLLCLFDAYRTFIGATDNAPGDSHVFTEMCRLALLSWKGLTPEPEQATVFSSRRKFSHKRTIAIMLEQESDAFRAWSGVLRDVRQDYPEKKERNHVGIAFRMILTNAATSLIFTNDKHIRGLLAEVDYFE